MATHGRGSMAVTYSTGPNKSSSPGAKGEVAPALPSSMGPVPGCCITSFHLTVLGGRRVVLALFLVFAIK